jgi:glycosyltransferase involved in cell wall biosynthesis
VVARPRLKAALHPAMLLARRMDRMLLRATGLSLLARSTSYRTWLKRHGALTAADRAAIARRIAALPERPLMSVVMPVFNPDPAALRSAIASVRAQIWEEWELCVADDASTDPRIPALLAETAAADPRIRVTQREANGHICAASNTALDLARGEWVVLLDHDDVLAPEALCEIAFAAADHPDVQVVYSDEDKLDERGRRYGPYFKAGFDPELLLGQNVVNHLGAYRAALLRRVGGFREGFEGSQDHDLALRCLAAAGEDAFLHIPAVLYHWRQPVAALSYSQTYLDRCTAASRRAVEEHLAARGVAARVQAAPLAPHYNRVAYALPDPTPMVSVIVPTRDRAELLKTCLDGVLTRTEYASLEVIVVDNDSAEPRTHELFAALRADPRVRVLPVPGPFNYPALNNTAVAVARGDILLLLNNDTEVIEPGWLTELVSFAARPGIGAVGAKLLYPDRTVQHCGVVLGVGVGDGTVAGHFGLGAAGVDAGPFGWLALARSVSAVTAACLAVKRADWQRVGGMDAENLKVAYNDVDFCLRLRAAGLRNVVTPNAVLLHHESKSRGPEVGLEKQARFMAEARFMRAKWGALLDNDPYWSPNLLLVEPRFEPAPQPRVPRRWVTR